MALSPLNLRQEELARHRENKGRLAFAFARFKSQGPGAVEFEERVDFGMTFIERPFTACGWQVDPDAVTLLAAGDLRLPQATGYVTEWDQTSRDHYVGCWVAVSVMYPPEIDPEQPFTIFHDFTWSGVALKDIPIEP